MMVYSSKNPGTLRVGEFYSTSVNPNKSELVRICPNHKTGKYIFKNSAGELFFVDRFEQIYKPKRKKKQAV